MNRSIALIIVVFTLLFYACDDWGCDEVKCSECEFYTTTSCLGVCSVCDKENEFKYCIMCASKAEDFSDYCLEHQYKEDEDQD